MSSREKKLAYVVGTMTLLMVAVFGYKSLFTDALRSIDAKTASLVDQLIKARTERRTYFKNEEKLKELTALTFSDQVESASAKSGAMLTKEILRSGLSEASFTRLPVGPRKMRGADEIGWNIQGSGPLDKIINLLFALQNSPYLHRLDNISLSPGDGENHVKVRFNFLTLVIQAAPVVDFVDLEPKPDLQSPERLAYNTIISRNLLQPYVEPPPPPPAAPETSPDPTEPSSPSGPGPESFRIVSLSEWNGKPEIHVLDTTRNETASYQTGDTLAGGTIVQVDYRPLPKPGSPGLNSFSRVILRIRTEYWAIEKGQTLAEKYKLAPEHLPPGLPKS